MHYDFDTIIPRRGTGSYKWDTAPEPDILPMWVADMDFRTAPAIIEALRKRVEHGIFGYAKTLPAYYEAITGWFARRHGWQISPEWILNTTGVVPALSAIIKALTVPGDKVLVQTPVYNCFFSSIRNNECALAANPLLYREGRYSMDFDDLERQAADPAVKLMLLCNPHNPAGRVWTKEELLRVADICRRNQVLVVADEIHCELVYPGHTYIPFASLSEETLLHSVTCVSPSKSFNIAGIQAAQIVAADESLRKKISKVLNINEVCDINCFAAGAVTAAYNEGEGWLDALNLYVYENYSLLREYFARHLPQFPLLPLEGTYLAWIDCSALGKTSSQVTELLLKQGSLKVNNAEMYGETETCFIRLNLACPRALLRQGLDRIRETFQSCL